jgi:MFS family permease
MYDSNLYAALFDFIKPELRASSVGIMTAFAFLVGALAPVVLGYVKTEYGLTVGISGLSVFYIFSAIMIFLALKYFSKKEFYIPIEKENEN